MLNSFWGKFGENLQKSTTEAIHTAHHLFALVSNPFDDIRQVRYSPTRTRSKSSTPISKRIKPDNGRVNIFVAAFTTCHARLKLYSYLEQLQQRVLFFDTDSVIYTTRPGQLRIPPGDNLRETTNELMTATSSRNSPPRVPRITATRPPQGKVCCKVRGLTLNVRGSQQLNCDVMRQNLTDEITQPQDERHNIDVVNPYFFWRNPSGDHTHQTLRTRL